MNPSDCDHVASYFETYATQMSKRVMSKCFYFLVMSKGFYFLMFTLAGNAAKIASITLISNGIWPDLLAVIDISI